MDFSSFQCPFREHGNDDYHRVLVGSVYDTSMISLGVHAVEDLHIDVLVLEYTIPSVLSSYTYFFYEALGEQVLVNAEEPERVVAGIHGPALVAN